jgi:hypothetical protein
MLDNLQLLSLCPLYALNAQSLRFHLLCLSYVVHFRNFKASKSDPGLDLPIEKFGLKVQFAFVLSYRLVSLFLRVIIGTDSIEFLIVRILQKVMINVRLIAPMIF